MTDDRQARTITADRGDAGRRLDLVLRRHLGDLPLATRTRVQAWIENGRVTVNGEPAQRTASRVAAGDALRVALPDTAWRSRPEPENLPIRVLYEDDYLIAVDKPPGLVVHPTYRHATGTLMHGLLWRARHWPAGTRPSIVGRLDKLTSGIVLAAKTAAVHARLQRAMLSPATRKEYLALVYGHVPAADGRIDLRLARDPNDRRRVIAGTAVGTPSLTCFTRLAASPAPRVGLSMLRCRLMTGRMHQIRVHLSASGWPLVGDPKYGEPRWSDVADGRLAETLRLFPRQALHAWRLEMMHPITRAGLIISAPIADDLQTLIGVCGLGHALATANAPEPIIPEASR